MKLFRILILQGLCLSWLACAYAQNPLIQNQFTADPSARVFNGRVYVYPSHDIPCTEGKGRIGWFCMEDYHVFSSADLKNWTDHGVILSQETVPWADPTAYSMWAPDAIERNGKYYFYFPTKAQDTTYNGQGFSIGVAVANSPTGPFEPQPKPIIGVKGIDPNVFIDKDGQAYLYWSQGHLYGAKLKENMLELASEPQILQRFPDKGLKEGPYLFERNGLYYMTYPHVENNIERLEYATGNNPMGPFTFRGVVMDESPTGCWTNHQSIISFQNQWYLFYHHNDLSPNFDKNRSIRMDSLSFAADGSINKVIPTLRGVGITEAGEIIQPDRYSRKSPGAILAFNDTLNRFEGWHIELGKAQEWVQYNEVRLGQQQQLSFRVASASGGTLQLRLGSPKGPLLSEVKIPKGTSWTTLHAKVLKPQAGVHNLVFVMKAGTAKLDWVQFKATANP